MLAQEDIRRAEARDRVFRTWPAEEAFPRFFGSEVHVSLLEVSSKDGAPYPTQWHLSRLWPLALEFEFIRTLLGQRPIPVSSGYRTADHNRRVGGARNSQHLHGRALDLLGDPAALLEAALYRYRNYDSRIRGIGTYSGHLHVDTRPADRLYRWSKGA